MRSGNIEDAFCKYCTPNTISNSRHSFLECAVAKCAWAFLNKMTKELFNVTQKVDPSIIFSLSIKAKSNSVKTTILDLSTCVLHFLHKVSFKEKLNPIELECFLFKNIISFLTVFANKVIERNVQFF